MDSSRHNESVDQHFVSNAVVKHSFLESIDESVFKFSLLGDSAAGLVSSEHFVVDLENCLITSDVQLLCNSAEPNILNSVSYMEYDKALREL